MLFIAGRAPMLLVMFISTLVPYTDRPPLRGLVIFSSAIMPFKARSWAGFQAARSSDLLIFFSVLITTAFRFLLPPTQPVPPRPLARSFSLIQQANLTWFSPPGPMA